jgi:hypothetical protein
MSAWGSDSVAADDLEVSANNLVPNNPGLLFAGQSAVNGGDGVVFGDGLRCAGDGVVRLGTMTASATGDAHWGPGLAELGGFAPGDQRFFQVWYRDPFGVCTTGTFNLTNAMRVTFTP